MAEPCHERGPEQINGTGGRRAQPCPRGRGGSRVASSLEGDDGGAGRALREARHPPVSDRSGKPPRCRSHTRPPPSPDRVRRAPRRCGWKSGRAARTGRDHALSGRGRRVVGPGAGSSAPAVIRTPPGGAWPPTGRAGLSPVVAGRETAPATSRKRLGARARMATAGTSNAAPAPNSTPPPASEPTGEQRAHRGPRTMRADQVSPAALEGGGERESDPACRLSEQEGHLGGRDDRQQDEKRRAEPGDQPCRQAGFGGCGGQCHRARTRSAAASATPASTLAGGAPVRLASSRASPARASSGRCA